MCINRIKRTILGDTGIQLNWSPTDLSQLIIDVLLETETKRTLLVNFLNSISEDKRKERTLVQRFLHANQTLSDQIYITIGHHGNLLLSRLNALLAATDANEQGFGDIKRRTYLSDRVETSAFHMVANATVFDFIFILLAQQNEEQFKTVFKMVKDELTKCDNTEKANHEFCQKFCPKCGVLHNDKCSKNMDKTASFEAQVVEVITRKILHEMDIINAEKNFDDQWNLIDELEAMDFMCSGDIQKFLQYNKRKKSHKHKTDGPDANWEFNGWFFSKLLMQEKLKLDGIFCPIRFFP